MLNALLSRPRRILATLALLLAATGLAIGSGASFSSATANPANTFTAGTLTQSNSKANAAVLTATNMKPGDTKSGIVTIKNTGSLAGQFSLSTSNYANGLGSRKGFTTADLQVSVVDQADAATPIYTGALKSFPVKALGTFPVGGEHTYKITVTFPETTRDQNDDQGAGATVDFNWSAAQTAASDLGTD